MTRISAAAIAALLVTCAPARAQVPSAAPEAAVRAAEDMLRQAIAAKDNAALQTLLAADFRAMVDGTAQDRAGWIDEMTRLCGGGRSSVRTIQVVVRDDSAIASYLATVNREDQCDPPTVRTRVADLWTLTRAGWRLSLRSSSPAEPEGEQPERAPSPPPGAPAAPAAAVPPAVVPPRPPAWAGSGELTILNTRGNVNTFTFGSTGDLAWQHGAWRTNARAAFLRTTSGGLERGRSVSGQLRQSRALSEATELFGRVLYQRDLFAGILRRYGGDAGLGMTVVHDSQRLQATMGVGSTHEVRLNNPAQSNPIATVGLQYRVTLNPATTITDEALTTASLDNPSSWRVESTVALTTLLRRPLALRTSYATKYIHQPVPGFKNFDAILSLSLVARF